MYEKWGIEGVVGDENFKEMWKVMLGIKEEKHLEKIEQDNDNCDEILRKCEKSH